MTRRPADQDGFQIRPPGEHRDVPDGWITDAIRWDGREMEIAYDPRRLRVTLARAGALDPPARHGLASTGWRLARTDQHGAELWLADRAEVARAQIDRLAAHRPEPGAPGLSVA